jgi:deoxyribodipyrimidine photo-lyase
MTAVLWVRRDLRVHDNPALLAAAQAHTLAPVFCFDDRLLHGRHASGARTQFLLESLADLRRSLRARGSGLVVRRGNPEQVLVSLAQEIGADRVHFSSDAGPFARSRDEHVRRALRTAGVQACNHPGMFAVDDLEAIRTTAGKPYTVFTPFFRKWREIPRRQVLAPPRALPPLPARLRRGTLPALASLGLRREIEDPVPGGEREGRKRMHSFLRAGSSGYADRRDLLAEPGTSRLSPYLHLGCVSPLEVESLLDRSDGSEAFRRQLCWRDFYAHVLIHFPANARWEHQARYRDALPFADDSRLFEAWRTGRTGYPLVDAAMRQLRHEGWMHNRARLVVGSFLTKHLGIDWRWGERWFMRLLLDGDEASNNGNWQWIASVGVDPEAPYRRIYNPARHQARFDPEGTYVRRHVSELRRVPDEFLAAPWRMPSEVQREAGCVIGRDYPAPIVDHSTARREALARYAAAGAHKAA